MTVRVQTQSGAWQDNPTIEGSGWRVNWDDKGAIELATHQTIDIDDVILLLKYRGWKVHQAVPRTFLAFRTFQSEPEPVRARITWLRSSTPPPDELFTP